MNEYRVFGGRLRSAVDFQRLPVPASDGPPDWSLEIGSGAPSAPPEADLGRDRVQDGIDVRLQRAGDGLRLVYDDSGVFEVSGHGDRITWWPGEEAALEAVRMDVLGRVLPLALHLQGFLVLHASAVVDGGRAVGFVGPKRSGKSTVALALHRGGARVLTDDVLVLDVQDEPVTARPGVPDLRLRRDTASAAGVGPPGDASVQDGGRTLFRLGGEPDSRPVPLSALYLLDPPAPEAPADAVAIHPLPGRRAAAALVGQTKLGPLLAGWDAAGLLERASTVVRSAAVRTLRLPRGLDRLQEAIPVVLASSLDVAVEEARAAE